MQRQHVPVDRQANAVRDEAGGRTATHPASNSPTTRGSHRPRRSAAVIVSIGGRSSRQSQASVSRCRRRTRVARRACPTASVPCGPPSSLLARPASPGACHGRPRDGGGASRHAGAFRRLVPVGRTCGDLSAGAADLVMQIRRPRGGLHQQPRTRTISSGRNAVRMIGSGHGFHGCFRQGLRGVRRQLAWVIRHRLIRVDGWVVVGVRSGQRHLASVQHPVPRDYPLAATRGPQHRPDHRR